MEFLARVDPKRVVIDPGHVRPTEWDLVAVLDDLRIFVTASRLIKATPILEAVDCALRLINGEPFVRAAREAQPPLEEIVCLVKTDQLNPDESPLFVPVSPTALMEEHPEQETYKALEMLSFVLPLASEDKVQVEHEIYCFFARVYEHPIYGGNYGWISDLDWDETGHRVSWVWERNDEPGQHQQLFLDVLRRIDSSIARLQSWNGLALHRSQ
jgi:hypothetical protein